MLNSLLTVKLSEETDYSLAFYIADGFMVLACLVALKLKVTLERSDVKVTESLRKIFSVPSVMFFCLTFCNGWAWGVHDTYLYVYIQEDLGGSSALISRVPKC